MKFAPLGRRLATSLLFGALALSMTAVGFVLREDIGLANALWLLGLGAGLFFAAVRVWRCRIELSASGVTIQSIFWTRSYEWSEVKYFGPLSIRSGFGAVTSPFLFVGHPEGAVEQIVMLPLLRPFLVGFESKRDTFDEVLAEFERFREQQHEGSNLGEIPRA